MCTGGDPGGGSEKQKPMAASRTAAPTREEMTAVRAPGQRNQAGGRSGVGMSGRGRIVSVESYNERPKEPGGVDDRAPKRTAAQTSFDSIQELRGRLDDTLLPGTAGAVLGSIGRASLKSQIKALQEGAIPVIADGMTVGTVSKSGSYTGRPEYGDIAREGYKKGGASIDTSMREAAARQRASERDRGPDEPKRAPVVEEPVSMTPVGTSGSRTTKTRRGGGRRTAFGTRQSLVNLRNV